MANVMMTNNIRHKIIENISNMFLKRGGAIEAQVRAVDLGRHLRPLLISPRQEALTAELLSEELMRSYTEPGQLVDWIRTKKNLVVMFVSKDYAGTPLHVEYVLPSSLPMGHCYDGRITLRHDSALLENEAIKRTYDLAMTYINCSVDRHILVTQVREILAQCNTLKQLVGVWPACLEYLDEATLQRYHAKPKKNTRERLKITGLNDELTVNLFKAKLQI